MKGRIYQQADDYPRYHPCNTYTHLIKSLLLPHLYWEHWNRCQLCVHVLTCVNLCTTCTWAYTCLLGQIYMDRCHRAEEPACGGSGTDISVVKTCNYMLGPKHATKMRLVGLELLAATTWRESQLKEAPATQTAFWGATWTRLSLEPNSTIRFHASLQITKPRCSIFTNYL